MRTIVGYQDGRPLWSENVPATAESLWSHTAIGGQAIVERTVKPRGREVTDLQARAHKGWETRRLRGEALEDARARRVR